MKTTASNRPISTSPHQPLRWLLATVQYTYLRLDDGRFVPVLAGGMVETAINSLGGVLRDVDPVSLPYQE